MSHQRRRPSFLPLVVLIGVTLAVATMGSSLDAQAPAAPSAPKTTRAGVYSAAQAARGEQTYMDACVSCHPPGTHKGGAFLDWQGYALDELVAFLTESMPEDDPGSLTPKEYTQVVAYLLKINGVPAGRDELSADPMRLRGIKIDFVPGRPMPSHHP
jgi:mono/diheme cytochrome c family protein